MILFIKENNENKEQFINDCVKRYCKVISSFNDSENCLKDLIIEKNKFTIEKDSKGKPFIKGLDKIKISISHSGNVLTVLLSDKDIGLDIEKIDLKRNYNRLAERYFNESELKNCQEKGAEYFYNLWTKKESYSKFIGSGITRQILKTNIDMIDNSLLFSNINFVKGYIINICHKKEDKLLILL